MSRDFIPAGSPLTSGQITTPICGFTIKPTTAVSTTSYWFHPSFMNLAVQQNLNIEVASLGAFGNRSTRVNVDMLYGVKQCSNIRVATLS